MKKGEARREKMEQTELSLDVHEIDRAIRRFQALLGRESRGGRVGAASPTFLQNAIPPARKWSVVVV